MLGVGVHVDAEVKKVRDRDRHDSWSPLGRLEDIESLNDENIRAVYDDALSFDDVVNDM